MSLDTRLAARYTAAVSAHAAATSARAAATAATREAQDALDAAVAAAVADPGSADLVALGNLALDVDQARAVVRGQDSDESTRSEVERIAREIHAAGRAEVEAEA